MEALFTKLGINYEIMKLIVKHKIIIDNRRKENGKDNLKTSLIVYFIIGLFSSSMVGLNINPVIKMTLYFGFFMIILLNIFIGDFSNVILDIDDKDILLTKGVDNRTLNASKLVHIFIYMNLFSLVIGSSGILVSLLKHGLGFAITLTFCIILIQMLLVFVTALLYTSIFKVFRGEKLKDIINIFQIGFTLIFIIGFQIMVNTFEFIDLQFVYEPSLWNILVPPMWFGSIFGIIQGIQVNYVLVMMSVLALVMPTISIIMYIRNVNVFENNLQKLNDNSDINLKSKKKLYSKVSNRICKDKEEVVFFEFIYNVLNKDREFKTKLYPTLAISIFLPFLVMISAYNGEGVANYILQVKELKIYLSIYFCVMTVQNIVTMIKYSNEHEGRWIYETLPIKNESNIYSAMVKVSIYKFILPMFMIIGIAYVLLFGIDIVIDVIIAILGCIIAIIFTYKIDEKVLPFTLEYKNVNSSSNIVTVFKSMFVVGILAVIHFGVAQNIGLSVVYAFILIASIKLMWKKIFRR